MSIQRSTLSAGHTASSETKRIISNKSASETLFKLAFSLGQNFAIKELSKMAAYQQNSSSCKITQTAIGNVTRRTGK